MMTLLIVTFGLVSLAYKSGVCALPTLTPYPDPRQPGGGLYDDAHARSPTWPTTDSRHSAHLLC
jgi:hypothetical protein